MDGSQVSHITADTLQSVLSRKSEHGGGVKKLDGKYRLARILANGTREIYPPWWWEEEKRKENGEGGTDETSPRFVRERVACRAYRLRLYFIASRVACKFNLVEVTQMQ